MSDEDNDELLKDKKQKSEKMSRKKEEQIGR